MWVYMVVCLNISVIRMYPASYSPPIEWWVMDNGWIKMFSNQIMWHCVTKKHHIHFCVNSIQTGSVWRSGRNLMTALCTVFRLMEITWSPAAPRTTVWCDSGTNGSPSACRCVQCIRMRKEMTFFQRQAEHVTSWACLVKQQAECCHCVDLLLCFVVQSFQLCSHPVTSPVYCLRFSSSHLYAALANSLQSLDFSQNLSYARWYTQITVYLFNKAAFFFLQ